MRVALLHPPTNCEEGYLFLEPLGIAYVAGACLEAGHEVLLRDLVNHRHADVPALFAELDRFRPEVVGLSSLTENFKNGLELARAVRERYGATVVYGGWHVSGAPAEVLDPALDFVVVGEGEETIVELLAHLDPAAPPGERPRREEIAGLCWAEDGRVVTNPPRVRRRDLASLPAPHRDPLPAAQYSFPFLFCEPLSRTRVMSLQASRGCPYTCTFCQTPAVWGGHWFRRPPGAVVDEIEDLVDGRGANVLWFRDEEFTVNRGWVTEICTEMVRRGLHRRVRWGAFSRPDDATPELVEAMAEAGCSYVFLGIESGKPGTLEKLHKGFALERAARSMALWDAADVTLHCGYIMGWPWDTRESIEQGFAWMLERPIDFVSIVFATPFGGTSFRREIEEQGLPLERDTNRYTVRDPVLPLPGLSLAELGALQRELSRRFYGRPAYLARIARRIARRPLRLRMAFEIVARDRLERLVLGRFDRGSWREQRLRVPPELRRPQLPAAASTAAPS